VCVLSIGSLLPFSFFPFSLLSCLLDLKSLLHKKEIDQVINDDGDDDDDVSFLFRLLTYKNYFGE
jgi:hypothetical protein